MVNSTPRPLYPGKDPVPIVREAGWAPGPVWMGAENLAPTGIRSPERPARSELSRPPQLQRELEILQLSIRTKLKKVEDASFTFQCRNRKVPPSEETDFLQTFSVYSMNKHSQTVNIFFSTTAFCT